uniref:Uncharacterized protein n=1 Tax=Alexandrium andersonii TaxID=327968 RepID=A0A7S2AC68_9DINO|mmetsp:Transcript_100975/g.226411  ORF Transcript_100975/g.226411 Transcript_100975/m.226411 type:complete len:100 (+) Transcript_100975:3-302(+)
MAYAPHILPMLNVEYGSGRGEDVVSTAHTASDTTNYGCAKKHLKKGGKKCPDAPKLRAALDELESLCQPRDVGSQGITLADLREQQSMYAGKVQWLLSY